MSDHNEPPPPSDQAMFMLGQIHGLVQSLKDGQDLQTARFDKLDVRMDKMDDRLRTVEQRSAAFGAVSGGAVGIGVALIVEGLKQWLKRGGPGP